MKQETKKKDARDSRWAGGACPREVEPSRADCYSGRRIEQQPFDGFEPVGAVVKRLMRRL